MLFFHLFFLLFLDTLLILTGDLELCSCDRQTLQQAAEHEGMQRQKLLKI